MYSPLYEHTTGAGESMSGAELSAMMNCMLRPLPFSLENPGDLYSPLLDHSSMPYNKRNRSNKSGPIGPERAESNAQAASKGEAGAAVEESTIAQQASAADHAAREQNIKIRELELQVQEL